MIQKLHFRIRLEWFSSVNKHVFCIFLLQYTNIWRDVEIEVNYDLVQQGSGGPILEKFNAGNPGASFQNVLRKTVRLLKKQKTMIACPHVFMN